MWSCHAALRGPPPAGSGSSTVSTRKLARPRRREQRADGAGHDAVGDGRVPVRAAHPPLRVVGVDQRERRVGERQHERVLGAQHAVDLAEHAVDVVDGREAPHRQHGVDGVGPDERQLGERGVVELDAAPPRARRPPGRRRSGRTDSSTPITLAPCRASAIALWPAPQPRSRTRLPSTCPSSRRVSSRGTSGP